MDAALFSAHDVNTPRASIEGYRTLPDGSSLIWALSRKEFGPMSFRNRPEWEVTHNRMQFLRIWDLKVDNLVAAGLEHTANVEIVGSDDARRGARELSTAPQATDGLLTRDTDLVLMTTHADCLPVWLCAPASGWVGVAHAGWRGLLAGIVRNLVEAVPADERGDIELSIGPGICADHYKVGADVAAKFREDSILAPAVIERNGDFHLNLMDGARRQAEAAGVAVDTSAFSCTYEQEHLSSFRRDGSSFAPMASFIVRQSR